MLGRRCTNVIQMFCVYWDTRQKCNSESFAKYKETASKSSRKYEQVRGGISGSRDGAGVVNQQLNNVSRNQSQVHPETTKNKKFLTPSC